MLCRFKSCSHLLSACNLLCGRRCRRESSGLVMEFRLCSWLFGNLLKFELISGSNSALGFQIFNAASHRKNLSESNSIQLCNMHVVLLLLQLKLLWCVIVFEISHWQPFCPIRWGSLSQLQITDVRDLDYVFLCSDDTHDTSYDYWPGITVLCMVNSTAKSAVRRMCNNYRYHLLYFTCSACIPIYPMRWERGKLRFCTDIALYQVHYKIFLHATHQPNMYVTQGPVHLIFFIDYTGN